MIIRFILSFIFMIEYYSVSAQIDSVSDNWRLFKEMNGVQFYSKTVNCHDYQNGIHQQLLLLQVVNNNQEAMLVEWDPKSWFNGKCYNCKDVYLKENHSKIILDSGMSMEGSCDKDAKRYLCIFIKFISDSSTSKMTNFEIANLKVIPIL